MASCKRWPIDRWSRSSITTSPRRLGRAFSRSYNRSANSFVTSDLKPSYEQHKWPRPTTKRPLENAGTFTAYSWKGRNPKHTIWLSVVAVVVVAGRARVLELTFQVLTRGIMSSPEPQPRIQGNRFKSWELEEQIFQPYWQSSYSINLWNFSSV